MSRLIFVPQFPSKMRYQEFWYTEFPKQMKKYFDEVIVLGETYINNSSNTRSEKHMFSPIHQAIIMEMDQINEFYNMKLYEDDYLFLSDLSFPGFFSNVLYHKKPSKIFAYCHATSKNNLDYFKPVRDSKFQCETAHSKLFKKVFVGSEYHKKKLGWNNIEVAGVPIPPYTTFKQEKIYDIISVARPCIQKITKKLEDKVERNFSQIIRKNTSSWGEYYTFLSSGKVLLITTKEETFGYSALEATMNNTIVIAPNNFSYPELLPRKYLYNDYNDLEIKLWSALNEYIECPKGLLCQYMCENFYDNIIGIMKE